MITISGVTSSFFFNEDPNLLVRGGPLFIGILIMVFSGAKLRSRLGKGTKK